MRIIVLGAGAIGSLFGAKLAAANDVTLVGRAAHVRAINADGLRIEGIESHTIRVRAVERIDAVAPDTVILLTTKVPATAGALAPIAPLVRTDTTLLSLQNGLAAESAARDALRDGCVVLRGITQSGAIFDEPGVLKYMAEGQTVIEQHERSGPIAEMFNAAGLRTRVSADIGRDVWHKLILNCVVNPITTIMGREVGSIADPQLDEFKQLVIDECLAVAAAEGVRFQIDFQSEIRELYAPSHNVVSMRQDLNRGRPTEIDYLNGAVAALGANHGINCPVNAALTEIIKAMEKRAAPIPRSRHNSTG
jgi:2-dehydropantoate 2-reductase